MLKIPVIAPKQPTPEEIRSYERMADAPILTIQGLAESLIIARAHAASAACDDARISAGIYRFMADTALRLAALLCADESEFQAKLNALMGIQFVNRDLAIARAVQLLLTVEARRLGLPMKTSEVHHASPTKPTLNS